MAEINSAGRSRRLRRYGNYDDVDQMMYASYNVAKLIGTKKTAQDAKLYYIQIMRNREWSCFLLLTSDCTSRVYI